MRISDWSSDVCSSDLAISTLKARNRRHAAELLHAYEETSGAPRKFEFEKAGVVEPGPDETSRSSEAKPLTWLQSLPFRTKGVPFNDLSPFRSEEHTSELQSLMRISYAVFCLKKKN